MIEGFDSRYWNGQLLSDHGGQFFIAKATESDYFANHLFPVQAEGALALGLDVGAYHFHRYRSDPASAARLYSHFCRPVDLAMGFPILDVEDMTAIPGTRYQAQLWDTVQELEQRWARLCMIYTARWYWDRFLFYPRDHPIYTRPLWEADPPPDTPDPGHFGPAVITQYRLNLKLSGINAAIDLDRADEAWYRENVNLQPF